MNKIMDKRRALCSVVWIIAVAVILSLWPLRLVKETVVSASNKKIVAQSEEITSGYVVKQMFIAQYDRLKEIAIYFSEGTVGETFNFVLYDASMNIVLQQVVSTADMKEIPGYCKVQVNLDTEVGREYYFLVQGLETPLRVAYENTEECGNIYNGTLYYGNVEDTEHCMVAEYDYEVPLRKGKTLLCDALLVLFAVCVTYGSSRYYRKHPAKNWLVTVEQTLKAVANPVIAVITVAAMVSVWPCKLYTEDAVSILFYEISIILTALVLFYSINHNRAGLASTDGILTFLKDRWQGYLQAGMFAGAIWACCNYMNGLYEIHHTIAYRQVLIFFALALIVTYRKEEIFNLYNGIYGVLALIFGVRYYNQAVAALKVQEEQEILVVKLTVWVAVLTGFILLNTISMLVRRQIGRFSIWYGVLVAAFFALIILYRNTRGWPIYLVCAFVLYYLRMSGWDKRRYLLQNICNGILFHFMVMMVYCFLHRPYMFYQYYRYPFIFHTVTIAAVYLALVVTAALVKFLDAYRRCPGLAGVYKELFLLGASSVYLLFTLSRTGYLAMVVTALIVIPVCCFSLSQRWIQIFKAAGLTVAAILVCFPIIFTAQRLIPSVTADPRVHEIEELPTEIMHGRDMNSWYYITIQRFVQVFEMKVLGIPEEKCLKTTNYEHMYGDNRIDSPLLEQTGRILLVSAEDMAAGPETVTEDEGEDSYANGRLEIFRTYYERLNTFGHDDMGIMLPDGNYIVHAHNIYLQVAYDHGIYVGLVFILLGAGTFVQGMIYYHRRKEDVSCAALPLAILVLFAVAGLTEWIFHPCCPIAYCLLLTLAPLLQQEKKTV